MPDGRVEQLRRAGARSCAAPASAAGSLGPRVELAQARQQLAADEARAWCRRSSCRAGTGAHRCAVRLRLRAPHVEQRPHDAVLAAALDPARDAARHDAVEDGLDLVGRRVAGRAQPVGRERVADVPQLLLGRAAAAVHDLGAELLAAEAGVLLRLRPRAARGRRAARSRGSRAPDSACQRQVESAPPETRQTTSPPGWDQLVLADPSFDLARKSFASTTALSQRSKGPGMYPGAAPGRAAEAAASRAAPRAGSRPPEQPSARSRRAGRARAAAGSPRRRRRPRLEPLDCCLEPVAVEPVGRHVVEQVDARCRAPRTYAIGSAWPTTRIASSGRSSTRR